jgi:hypothetical protein
MSLYPLDRRRREDIGHGPLAHAAAGIEPQPEPVEFARLVQHLERGDLQQCSADACRQGRSPCPTPQACLLGADTDDGIGMFRGLVVALLVTLAAIGAALLIAALA